MAGIEEETNTKKINIEALQILNERTGRNIPEKDIYNILNLYHFMGCTDRFDLERTYKQFWSILEELRGLKHEDRKKKLLAQGYKICRRCGGSGHYSYNQKHGSICYGCKGAGVVPDKTGKGWREAPGTDGKAPNHKEVATRVQAKKAQNKPMERKLHNSKSLQGMAKKQGATK